MAFRVFIILGQGFGFSVLGLGLLASQGVALLTT